MDNKVLLKEETVVSIADAIREKSGSSEKMTPAQMAARIQNLTTTLPELENPGSAADLLAGKELIDGDGNVVVGTIPTANASTITMSSPTSEGKVTAYYTHRAGYKASQQTITKTVQLSTQAGKTITPTTSPQMAVAKDRWTTGAVTVAAIPSNYVDVSGLDIEPQDVVYGTEFIDGDGNRNTGTMPNIGAVNGHLEPMSGVETYTVPKGYHDGTGTVGIGEDLKDALITINGNTATNIAEAVNNVDTAVTDQANLISQIQTALKGKAAGESGEVGTCTIEVTITTLNVIVIYEGTDGWTFAFIDAFNTTSSKTFTVIQNSAMIIVKTGNADYMYPTHTISTIDILHNSASTHNAYIVNGDGAITITSSGGST